MLLSLFQWLEGLGVSAAIRDSLWLFPVIEAVHLLALCVLGGAVLAANLRLIGLILPRLSVRHVADEVYPWMLGALIVMIATGVPLFLSEAVKCYYNAAFWMKMGFLVVATAFTMPTFKRIATGQNEGVMSPMRCRVVGAISLALWSGVGLGGRAIGFY